MVERLEQRRGRQLRFCYEAGPCGYGLHRFLTGLGHACTVVAPSLIPIKAGDRIKTDRRGQGEYTRDHHADGFASAIIEGPDKWKVRPVSEFFYEEEIGVARTLSALVGAIWQVNDDLAFDLAVRHAIVNDAGTTGWHPVDEIRAGATFAFPMSMFSGSRQR
jgi:hypothetical protein